MRIKAPFFSLIARCYLILSGCQVGRNLYSYGLPHVFNPGNIVIGSNVKLISASVINAVGCAQRLCLHTGPNGRLTLEDHVGISNSVLFAAKNITIHHHTIIGGGCALYDTDFHELLPEDRNPRSYYVRTAPVSIGPHAFVGGHTIILKGVSIGEGALVAAGSVVTKSVPPFEVWAGNPARFARQLDSTLKMNRNLEGS